MANKLNYVHGHQTQELERLVIQAKVLQPFVDKHTVFPANSSILEAGCGVGAQTVYLAALNPDSHFTCIDIDEGSLALAKQRCAQAGIDNVTFVQADIYELPFEDQQFDHCILFFVLEHFDRPIDILDHLKTKVSVGGTIRAIECDNSTTKFTPSTAYLRLLLSATIELQGQSCGNGAMGSILSDTMVGAGLNVTNAQVISMDTAGTEYSCEARTVFREALLPLYRDFGPEVVAKGLVSAADWQTGVKDLIELIEDPQKHVCAELYLAEGVV